MYNNNLIISNDLKNRKVFTEHEQKFEHFSSAFGDFFKKDFKMS